MDFGIDLGTTNSAIAVVSNGQVEVIKNNENQEITPSVVQFSESGAVTVGRKPYEHLRLRADGNAHAGFKRQMGKSSDTRSRCRRPEVTRGASDRATEVSAG